MTGFSIGVRAVSPHASRARRVRILRRGRQTRFDIVATVAMLAVSAVAILGTVIVGALALPALRDCGTACGSDASFELFVIAFLASLLVGATFGARAVLNLLNRRRACGYALLHAGISVAVLLGGIVWLSTL